MLTVSRRTRNWILALILVPAAAFGVAKLTVWYSVKDGLDDIQASMAPFASLEYTKILSPVFGAFGASGIRIKPHLAADGISIGSALIHVEDPVEKYGLLSNMLNETIPTSLNLSLNAVRLPLDGELAAWFNAGAAAPAGPAAACAAGTGFTIEDVKKMGYEELVADVRADYAYDRRGRGLSTYLKLQIRDMFELTLEGRVPPTDVVFAVDRMDRIPRLSDLTLTLRDLSWSPRFNRYCADAMAITEAAYVEKRVREAREALTDSGFEPSAELLAAIKQFVQGSASITLTLNPREPVDPMLVRMDGDLAYMIDRLGVELRVEGTPVRDLGAARVAAVDEEEAAEEQQPRRAETFKPTPLAELPQFLNRSIRIFTIDGKVHNGHLDSVGAESLVLTRHLAGGSASFDVLREDVDRVLVLRD